MVKDVHCDPVLRLSVVKDVHCDPVLRQDGGHVGVVLSPHMVGFMKPGKLWNQKRSVLLMLCITFLFFSFLKLFWLRLTSHISLLFRFRFIVS